MNLKGFPLTEFMQSTYCLELNPLLLDRIDISFFQNDEIEKIVQDLLHLRLIQTSQNPFSSPVIFIRKDDGSQRLYVDHKALNHVTMKDKFFILLVELLDKQNSSKFFFLNQISDLDIIKYKLNPLMYTKQIVYTQWPL